MIRTDLIRITSAVGIVALVLATFGCGESASDEPLSGATIVIQHGEVFGELQRPAVPFDHARHTEILGDKGCQDCHSEIGEGGHSYTFVPSTIQGASQVMDEFHGRCLGCHEEQRASGDLSPPLACADCHQRGIGERPTEHADAGWDYQVHSRHVIGQGNQCETCHHQFDEPSAKLVYVKGEEGACQDCHGRSADGDTPSLRTAAHQQCVQCHLDRARKSQTAGPTTCVGCHEERPEVDPAVIAALPRLDRGQSDTLEIELDGGRLAAVGFDHKGHETRTQFCRDCHHASMESCHECHTLEGTGEGGGVTAQMAFHATSSQNSCVGCHEERTRETGCAGCHQLMPAEMPRETCTVCHAGDSPAELASAEANSGGDVHHASAFVAAAPTVAQVAILGDAPDDVTIDGLAADYSVVTYPHKAVYEALRDTTSSSELAQAFHGTDETLCYGCHHNSPAGQKPPACGTCHERMTFDERTPGRPGLKAAYHLQCLGCHQAMKIEPQTCAEGCHTPASGQTTESEKAEETR